MKYPHIQLYTADWLTDPQLSICSPATRGIWIDLVCRMHENGRTGEVRGTAVQLARLARCSQTEIEAALLELSSTGTSEISSNEGVWTIANRRMQRDALRRGECAKAGSKGGSKTQANREATPYQRALSRADIDIDIDSQRVGERERERGRERVRHFAVAIGVSEKDADWFFFKCEGNGWTNGGRPIRDWKATLRTWFYAGYLPSQRKRPATIPTEQDSRREHERREVEQRLFGDQKNL